MLASQDSLVDSDDERHCHLALSLTDAVEMETTNHKETDHFESQNTELDEVRQTTLPLDDLESDLPVISKKVKQLSQKARLELQKETDRLVRETVVKIPVQVVKPLTMSHFLQSFNSQKSKKVEKSAVPTSAPKLTDDAPNLKPVANSAPKLTADAPNQKPIVIPNVSHFDMEEDTSLVLIVEPPPTKKPIHKKGPPLLAGPSLSAKTSLDALNETLRQRSLQRLIERKEAEQEETESEDEDAIENENKKEIQIENKEIEIKFVEPIQNQDHSLLEASDDDAWLLPTPPANATVQEELLLPLALPATTQTTNTAAPLITFSRKSDIPTMVLNDDMMDCLSGNFGMETVEMDEEHDEKEVVEEEPALAPEEDDAEDIEEDVEEVEEDVEEAENELKIAEDDADDDENVVSANEEDEGNDDEDNEENSQHESDTSDEETMALRQMIRQKHEMAALKERKKREKRRKATQHGLVDAEAVESETDEELSDAAAERRRRLGLFKKRPTSQSEIESDDESVLSIDSADELVQADAEQLLDYHLQTEQTRDKQATRAVVRALKYGAKHRKAKEIFASQNESSEDELDEAEAIEEAMRRRLFKAKKEDSDEEMNLQVQREDDALFGLGPSFDDDESEARAARRIAMAQMNLSNAAESFVDEEIMNFKRRNPPSISVSRTSIAHQVKRTNTLVKSWNASFMSHVSSRSNEWQKMMIQATTATTVQPARAVATFTDRREAEMLAAEAAAESLERKKRTYGNVSAAPVNDAAQFAVPAPLKRNRTLLEALTKKE